VLLARENNLFRESICTKLGFTPTHTVPGENATHVLLKKN